MYVHVIDATVEFRTIDFEPNRMQGRGKKKKKIYEKRTTFFPSFYASRLSVARDCIENI